MDRPQRIDDLCETALHVEGTRSAEAVRLDTNGHLTKRSERPDRVAVSQEQLPGNMICSSRRSGEEMASACVPWDMSDLVIQTAQLIGEDRKDVLLCGGHPGRGFEVNDPF